jgi:hypothetical protein
MMINISDKRLGTSSTELVVRYLRIILDMGLQIVKSPFMLVSVKNNFDVVQLYGCGAQGTLYLYSEDTMITACIRLLVVFYMDSK